MTEDVLSSLLGLNPLEALALRVGLAIVSGMTAADTSSTATSPGDLALKVISQMPGRARFQIDAIRRSPGAAARVEERLRRWAGVTIARANPVTGSVLVTYDEELVTLSRLIRSAELSLSGLRVIPASHASEPDGADHIEHSDAPVPIKRFLEPVIA